MDGLCQGKLQIFTTEIPSTHTICLNPTNDISIFYIDESKINQNYYNGKIIKYILNNEYDSFNINNIFIITGKEEYKFELNLVSLKITNIINKK